MIPDSARNWIAVEFKNPASKNIKVYVPELFSPFRKIFENFDLQIPEKDSQEPLHTMKTKNMTTLHLRNSSGETPDPLSAGQTASEGFVRTPKVFVMKIASKKLLLLSLITTFVAAQALAQQIKPDETKRIQLNQAYGKLPLSFEANQGQTNPQVKFLSRGNGYSLFLTTTEAVLVLKKTARDNNAQPGVMPSQAINDQHKTLQSSLPATVLRMKLVRGNASAKIAGSAELPGKSNYLIGNDPKQWRTNISNYTKVEYRNVYPGI